MENFILLHDKQDNTPIIINSTDIIMVAKKNCMPFVKVSDDAQNYKANGRCTVADKNSNPTVVLIKMPMPISNVGVLVNESVERIFEMLKNKHQIG